MAKRPIHPNGPGSRRGVSSSGHTSRRPRRMNGNHRDWGVHRRPAGNQARVAGYDQTNIRTRRYRTGNDRAEFAVANDRTREQHRSACRDQDRTNSIFIRILNATIENVIGRGPRIIPSTSDPEWNAQASAIIEQSHHPYHFTPKRNSSERKQSCHALRSKERDGGVILYRPRGHVQIFEEGQLRTPLDADKNTVRNGMQYDAAGAIEGYWVGPHTRSGYPSARKADMVFLPAWHVDNEMGVVLPTTTYWFDSNFVSADRGMSSMVASLEPLDQLDDYIQAVLERAIQEACILGTLKSSRKDADQSVSVGRKGTDDSNHPAKDEYDKISFLEPGIVPWLHPDDDFQMHAPTTPNQMFRVFFDTITRTASAHRAQPLEVTMLEFDQTNFSAARAAIEQAKRLWTMIQDDMRDNWYLPNSHWRLYEAIIDGRLPHHPEWQSIIVQPAGWQYLNPREEATANETMLQNESNLSEVLAKRGSALSVEKFLEQRADEIRKARRVAGMSEAEINGPIDPALLLPYGRPPRPVLIESQETPNVDA